MLFADVDWGSWLMAGGAATIGVAATTVFSTLWNIFKDRRKVAVDEWREIVARQDAQIAGLQVQADGCREREMRLTRLVVYLHGVANNLRDGLARVGQMVEAITPLDTLLPDEQEQKGQDFSQRTLQQNSALLHAEAKKVDQGITNKPPTTEG